MLPGGAPSLKNIYIGGAATDMGLGGDLLDEEKRRKKLLEDKKNSPAAYGDNMTSPMAQAAMAIWPNGFSK